MEEQSSFSRLWQFLLAIGPLPETLYPELEAIWTPFSARRKMVLTAEGEKEKHLYFVLEGVQRAFYLHGEKDATIVFTYPWSFSGVADSFLTGHPSRYYFETLTTSVFLRTTREQLLTLTEKYRSLEQVIFKATAFALEGALQRQIELQAFSAEEKFRTLLTRSPQVLQLIPHKYLASYLGIDPATFSKLLGGTRL